MQAVVTSLAREFPGPGRAPTSRAAYESVRPFLSEMAARIYGFVALKGDATMDEIEVGLGLKHQTVGPVTLDVRNRGLLVALRDAKGVPVKRPTRSGRMALVYTTVPRDKAVPRNDARQSKYEIACGKALIHLEAGSVRDALDVLRGVAA